MKKFNPLPLSALFFLMLASVSQACVVSGFVLCDANQNGVIETNDPGIAGVLVIVTNQTGTFSNSVVTAADGSFSLLIPAFDPLAEVRDPLSQVFVETLSAATLPPGSTVELPTPITYISPTPAYYINYAEDLTNVTYTSGSGTSSNGNWLLNTPECQPPPKEFFVTGFVVRDANQNGVIDTNDTGIPNVQVIVTNENNTFSNSVVTGTDGFFILQIPPFDSLAETKDPLSQIYVETLNPATLPPGSIIELPTPITYISPTPQYFIDYASDLTTLVYTSGTGNSSMGNWLINICPAFFHGETPMDNGMYQLMFTDGTPFGYFYPESFPYVYHMDMGWEYFIDANDGQGSAYLYDFSSGGWWYSSPQLFPYVYDFNLRAWLYYCPDASNAGHYTANPRWFFNFANGTFITH